MSKFESRERGGINMHAIGSKSDSASPSPLKKRIEKVLHFDHYLLTREQRRLKKEGKDPQSVFQLGDEDSDLPEKRKPHPSKPIGSGSVFTRTLDRLSGQEKVLVLGSLRRDTEQTPEERMRLSLGKVLTAARARVELFQNGVPVIGSGIFGRDSAVIAPEGLQIFGQGAPPRKNLPGEVLPDTIFSFEDIADGRVEFTIDQGGRTQKPPKLIQIITRRLRGADVGTVTVRHAVTGEEYQFMGVPNPASVVKTLYQTATAFAGEEAAKTDLRELKAQYPELFIE